MNKLTLAALTAAIAICVGIPACVPQAEAGMRLGFGFGHRHVFRPHFYTPPPRVYRSEDEDERRIRRYRAARQSKPEKAEKVVRKIVPLVKFADGEGRQFDPASKIWFDGNSQCWSGKEQFTFKNGDWSYGKKEWAQSNGTWKVSSGESPELVSCQSVPSFAATANTFATKTAAQSGKLEKAENADKGASSQPTPATPAPAKIKTAESDASAVAQKPVTTPASAECKKYFPSVGQMISVPCAE
jgi:hypothetical protein